jgi:hypothetical protein
MARLRQIGLNPGAGRYENPSRFAAAILSSRSAARNTAIRPSICMKTMTNSNRSDYGLISEKIGMML